MLAAAIFVRPSRLLAYFNAPTLNSTHQTRLGDRAFRVAGPSVWNNLPADLRHPDLSLGQIHRVLKRFCLTGSAAPSDCLLFGAAYKCMPINALTYLLTKATCKECRKQVH